MVRRERYELEPRLEITEKHPVRGDLKREVQRASPQGCTEGPWISLIGDCFFTDTYQYFGESDLESEDLPYTIAVDKGKIEDVMKFAESKIPGSTRFIVVHLGANNIASESYQARWQTSAQDLVSKCTTLRNLKQHVKEISLCLLSDRAALGKYGPEYIKNFNRRARDFNRKLGNAAKRQSGISTIDLGLHVESDPEILGVTGFGPSEKGKKAIVESLCSLIKFKVNTSEGDDKFFKEFYPPDTEPSDRKVVLRRDDRGNDVSLYTKPQEIVRLDFSGRRYPESELPKLDEDMEGFKPVSKRPRKNWHVQVEETMER